MTTLKTCARTFVLVIFAALPALLLTVYSAVDAIGSSSAPRSNVEPGRLRYLAGPGTHNRILAPRPGLEPGTCGLTGLPPRRNAPFGVGERDSTPRHAKGGP